jgi:hypothetical protein
MFFGVFSTILPYLIAAGFYLLWMLFSIAQPVVQKFLQKDKNPEAQKILVDDIISTQDSENCFDYNDHFPEDDQHSNDITNNQKPTFEAQFEPGPFPRGKVPHLIGANYSSGLLIRPPPAF